MDVQYTRWTHAASLKCAWTDFNLLKQNVQMCRWLLKNTAQPEDISRPAGHVKSCPLTSMLLHSDPMDTVCMADSCQAAFSNKMAEL